MSDLKFRGYAVKDTNKWTEFDVVDFECVLRCSRAAHRADSLAAGPWVSVTTLSTSRCADEPRRRLNTRLTFSSSLALLPLRRPLEQVEFCGICGSDVHTITGGWGAPHLPLVSGHEIAGTVRSVGAGVKEFKQGDRVIVGAQIDACGKCRQCQVRQVLPGLLNRLRGRKTAKRLLRVTSY